MISARTKKQRYALTGMALCGLDRLYQQLDNEVGFILTLHRVREPLQQDFHPNEHLEVTPKFLDEVLHYLRNRDLEIISMGEVAERLKSGKRSRRFCAITFDDAYMDTFTNAVPILERHNAPYTIYVASGLVNGTAHLWWERVEALVHANERLSLDFGQGIERIECKSTEQKFEVWEQILEFAMRVQEETAQAHWVKTACAMQNVPVSHTNPGEIMSWDNVRDLHARELCTIGSHTVSHKALGRLSSVEMSREIEGGGHAIAREIGHFPTHLAYPYGFPEAAGEREFRRAKTLELTTAVTTRPGMLFADHRDHITALPRISVNGLYQRMRYFAPLTSGLPTRLKSGFKRLNVA